MVWPDFAGHLPWDYGAGSPPDGQPLLARHPSDRSSRRYAQLGVSHLAQPWVRPSGADGSTWRAPRPSPARASGPHFSVHGASRAGFWSKKPLGRIEKPVVSVVITGYSSTVGTCVNPVVYQTTRTRPSTLWRPAVYSGNPRPDAPWFG